MMSSPRQFSLMPFWFWNDELSEKELLRQIADFEDHGVYGFVIHLRVGLPRSIGWMSDELLRFMDIAICEAQRRDMKVILYDEGMYPSGSACGQLVAANPDFACRCLSAIDLAKNPSFVPMRGEKLVSIATRKNGDRLAIVDRKANSYIRGLHYIGEGPAEDEPPMGDILNPAAVARLIEIVHDRFAEQLGQHFGKTVVGIFTDEPHPLGKCRERHVMPGTTGILEHVNRILGYDFTDHLPALWFDDELDAARHRREYDWAIRRRMETTWYQPLHDWCERHGVALCGHPADGDEIGAQRFFHIPGQDLVWRWVLPGQPSGLEGPESTQAKNASSAMIHSGQRRNSNEFCGAYGSETTFEEFQSLANWCLVRGTNLLIPHAFYYSVRGPRKDERPPQVGPHSPWWDRFQPFADHCRMICWLNTDSQHVCDVAILTGPDHCPWAAAKVLFEHQIDFNYLQTDLLASAEVDDLGVRIAGMHYKLIVWDGSPEMTAQSREKLLGCGHLIGYHSDGISAGVLNTSDEAGLLSAVRKVVSPDVTIDPPNPQLRARHVRKTGSDYYFFFNEGASPVQCAVSVSAKGTPTWIGKSDQDACVSRLPIKLQLSGFGTGLLRVDSASSKSTP